MEMVEFKKYKEIKDDYYPHVNKFELESGETFFVEGNYYTQLIYIKDHSADNFDAILNKMEEIIKKNKKVIFTADFENPVVYKDDYIYQEIDDVLASLKLYFDNKSNPESDWKD